MSRREVVVVGNGMAGCRFVQELLDLDRARSCSITVVGEEPGGAYNRMLLSNVLAGRARQEDIELATREWYAGSGVTLHSDVSVGAIDREARKVELSDGTVLAYDVLVLATGSEPILPPAVGLTRAAGSLVPGAVAFRTLADCTAIDRLLPGARQATVVGAGVLGLEAARGLAGRGLSVRLIQRGTRLMERQLDAEAGRVLSRTVRAMGVEVRSGAGLREVHGTDHVRAITLDDGTRFDTDLLVLSCGVRPRVELARAAGLEVAAGVLVDDRLRTLTDPQVLAVGECAEHRGQTYGLVAPAWEQARVAARTVADPDADVRYSGSAVITRLKAEGIELATMGDSHALEDDLDEDEPGPEVIRFVDPGRGIYQKLVVVEGRLVGAILLGDARTVGTVMQLFDRGAPVPADRAGLLMPRRHGDAAAAASAMVSPMTMPGRTTICQCNGVTKSAICQAWEDGARSVADVADRTRATTGCGTCRDTVSGLVDWLAAADTPVAAGGRR
jgi:assimilatory nitrate reductase electron transfer subunit